LQSDYFDLEFRRKELSSFAKLPEALKEMVEQKVASDQSFYQQGDYFHLHILIYI
jgi:hypothetical protein